MNNISKARKIEIECAIDSPISIWQALYKIDKHSLKYRMQLLNLIKDDDELSDAMFDLIKHKKTVELQNLACHIHLHIKSNPESEITNIIKVWLS